MSNMRTWIQNDFSGGENSLMPPDSIGENEVTELTNLLPRRTEYGVRVREGFPSFADLGTGDVISMFTKLNISTNAVHLLAVIGAGSATKVYDYGDIAPILSGTVGTPAEIASYAVAPASFGKMYWCDWDGNNLFFTNGTIGVYHYDLDGAAAVLVKDKSAGGTPDIPEGKYLTQHKGRMFYARNSDNDSFTTVAVCGSDDSVNARWESWSGTTQSSGGSVDVVPYGTKITGLASSYGGLLIFKEQSISLWSYTDTDAPWNAASGASIEQLISGVGCVEHDTIVENNGVVYFLGRSDAGDIGLYSIDGSNVSLLSSLVPRQMKKLVLSSQAKVSANVFDNYYMLIAQSSDRATNTVVAVCDILSGSWSTYTSPTIYCDYRPVDSTFVIFGGVGGKLYKHPSDVYYDDASTPIPVTLKTRRILNGDTNHEAYYRMVWLSGGSVSPMTFTLTLLGDQGLQQTLTVIDVTSSSTDTWNDGSNWNDGSVWEFIYATDEHYAEADMRSRGAVLKVYGEASSDCYIDTISVGYRERRVGNAKNV